MNYSADTFDRICDLMEARLNVLGPIKTDDAWKICGRCFGYSTITSNFRKIMNLMVAQKKAVHVGHGKWNILKPNISKKNG